MEKISLHIVDLNNKKHTISVPVDVSLNLMEVVRDAGFQMGHCGGMALCASCHCYIKTDTQFLNKTTEEIDMLDQLHSVHNTQSRLICQIKINKDLDGLVLQLVDD